MNRFLRHLCVVTTLVITMPGLVRVATAAAPVSPEEAETLARIGAAIAEKVGLRNLDLTDAQLAALTEGIRAAYSSAPRPVDEATRRLLDDMQRRVTPPTPATVNPTGPIGHQDHRLERYLALARENFLMQQSSTGLLFRIRGGGGPRPRPNDTVVVSIAATAPDGTTALPQISAPSVRTKVADLLPGLAEGVQMMALGAEGSFILPPHLSFGVGQWPEGLEPGMPLLYRLTLDDIAPANAR